MTRNPVKREQLPECFGNPKTNTDCIRVCQVWAACIRNGKVNAKIKLVAKTNLQQTGMAWTSVELGHFLIGVFYMMFNFIRRRRK